MMMVELPPCCYTTMLRCMHQEDNINIINMNIKDPFLIYTIPTFKKKKRTIKEHEYNNKPYQ